MRVTVIVCVRNGARFLARALESIVEQSRPVDEVLLVDGHSSDDTVNIARQFQVQVITQPGTGIANAYNTGLAHASGDYIAFLSHDDLWVPTKTSRQLEVLSQHPNALYCVGQAAFFLESHTIPPEGVRQAWLERPHMAYIMETLLARREAFERVGKFNGSLSTAEDVDWFARARDQRVSAVALEEVLVRKRIHDANTSLVTPENSRNVLRALRESVLRKRGQP
jgi:glycosyltransferase involved in cell wall biosynthesis